MEDYVQELQNKYAEELGNAAYEYLEAGIEMFHRYRQSESSCGQAAVGNMLTALELLLKSFIASKNLGSIFKDIPPEMRVFLSNPGSVPRFFKWHNYDINLRSHKYRTLDFEDCIESYYIFFPQLKQLLMPHINFLLRWTHTSLHGVLPALNMYEFERIGFVLLYIITTLTDDKSFQYSWYTLTDTDRLFFRDFESKRKERVDMAIEQAEQKSLETTPDHMGVIIAHNWETFVTGCPVCTLNGLLEGYTELAIGEDEDGPFPTLDFFATAFICEECGLTLHDIEELKLANMSILYDRTGEIDKWFKEHETVSNWYLDTYT